MSGSQAQGSVAEFSLAWAPGDGQRASLCPHMRAGKEGARNHLPLPSASGLQEKSVLSCHAARLLVSAESLRFDIVDVQNSNSQFEMAALKCCLCLVFLKRGREKRRQKTCSVSELFRRIAVTDLIV